MKIGCEHSANKKKLPSIDGHTRWTPPLPLASAAPRRTPRRAISQLIMPQRKPSIVYHGHQSVRLTIMAYSTHIFALVFDLDFESPLSYGLPHMHAKN